ncbi:enoyl-CoA hydratase [Planctobacterium marinum]|uniref:Enoyl-CoA hydratase n=1 Tax=Planctobacterium marinum TaxID=1631968 RepID=A0AA48HPF9_9ALTE|nr:enoyl-CoA hydratase [Planctobacterium marinum]
MSLILIEIQQHCLVLTLNRPEKRNALSSEMYQQLADALNANRDNEQIKSVLITGAGEHFTAGNDLSQFAKVQGKDELASTLAFMQALSSFPMPVIAQVRGMAVGIGTTMLLHCDFVYCDNTATFSLPFINLALVPEYASSLLLPELVGHRKASEWLMLGESFDAAEAEKHGLVNKVAAAPDLQSTCAKVVAGLAKKPAMALKQTKALMKSSTDKVNLHIDTEIDVFVEQLKSEAAKEAFSAFLDKRKPDPTKYR